MKKIMVLSVLLTLSSALFAESEPDMLQVTGDDVNLRSRPSLMGEIVGQVGLEDKLVFQFSVGDLDEEWLAVAPPPDIDAWVSAEYIKDGVVIADKLNVRAGPSLNYARLTVVDKGTEVGLRGDDKAAWIRIDPPAGSTVWISTKYAELIEQKPIGIPDVDKVVGQITARQKTNQDVVVESALEPSEESVPESVPETETQVEETIATSEESSKPAEEPAEVAQSEEVCDIDTEECNSTNEFSPETGDVEVLDPYGEGEMEESSVTAQASEKARYKIDLTHLDVQREQDVQVKGTGILMPTSPFSLYQLVGLDQALICFVRGDESQMKKYSGRYMTIIGKKYGVEDLNPPVVVPEKIILQNESSARESRPEPARKSAQEPRR